MADGDGVTGRRTASKSARVSIEIGRSHVKIEGAIGLAAARDRRQSQGQGVGRNQRRQESVATTTATAAATATATAFETIKDWSSPSNIG